MNDNMYITVKEAVRLTGLAEMTIRNYMEDGKLKKYYRVVGKVTDVLHVDKLEALYLVPTVISIFMQKGGVSKTTTALLLGDYYDKMGVKTLLVDFDQQGNLSQTFFSQTPEDLTLYDYLEGKTKIKDIVRPINNNLSILPSNIKLAAKDSADAMRLVYHQKSEFLKFFADYKVVIIDCPPALNSMSTLATMISNYIIMPLNDEPYTFVGLTDALDTIKMAFANNTDLIDYFGFSSRYYKRTTEIRESLRDNYIDILKGHFIKEYYLPFNTGFVDRIAYKKNIFEVKGKEIYVKEVKDLFGHLHTCMFDNRK